MYLNPFSRHHKGVIEVPAFDLDCALPSVRPTQIDTALYSDTSLHLPHIELDRESLQQLLPFLNRGSETNWLIPDLIGSTLNTFTRSPHKLEDLSNWAVSNSGTAVLASNGVIKHVEDLCKAVASRYALLLVIDMDRAMIARITTERSRYHLNRSTSELQVSAGASSPAVSLELRGESLKACLKPSTFLSIPRFDRVTFRGKLYEIVHALNALELEVKPSFKTFLAEYEKAYKRWTLGE